MTRTLKVMVTGSSGQVGSEVVRAVSTFAEVVTPSRNELSLNEPFKLEALLNAAKPDVIVNAVAWTAVDAAEEHREEAWRVNAELPKRLAEYARNAKILLIHYSTDYVYSGQGATPWKEDDAINPLSEYGKSKAAGDAHIARLCGNYVIFRTSWVYSARGNNFLNTMLRLGRDRASLSVVNDQIGAPTSSRLIAQVTALAVYRYAMGQPLPSDVYHLVAKDEASWYEFAHHIFKLAREQGEQMTLRENGLSPILTSDYPTPAVRPLNSRLNVTKLEKAMGITLPSWQNDLMCVMDELNNNKVAP
ncbi:MAG: dTDP-4-dehydrorhamnose reductase [Cyanobacteria bacterium P01_F01_bin.86]